MRYLQILTLFLTASSAIAADMTYSVNTPVIVPLNERALVDKDDGYTIKSSVTSAESGLALQWNFLSINGAYSQTTIALDAGSGGQELVNKGAGMYGQERF